MSEDLKFTTAGEYMDWYYNGSLHERYQTYCDLADADEDLLSFDEWLNQ